MCKCVCVCVCACMCVRRAWLLIRSESERARESTTWAVERWCLRCRCERRVATKNLPPPSMSLKRRTGAEQLIAREEPASESSSPTQGVLTLTMDERPPNCATRPVSRSAEREHWNQCEIVSRAHLFQIVLLSSSVFFSHLAHRSPMTRTIDSAAKRGGSSSRTIHNRSHTGSAS